MQILVVDDDPGVRRLVAATLTSEGWKVRTAANGHLALEEIREHPFDAIILDLQMPVMDGPSFYRALRDLPSDIPVLLLSAFDGGKSIQRELGANDALAKPFDPAVLVRRLQKLTAAAV